MPWHLEEIGVNGAKSRRVQETGHGVTVAMLDSGVFQAHRLFAPNAIAAVYTINSEYQVLPWEEGGMPPYRLLDDHGTAVAGLICAKTVGVAPGARLISLVLPFCRSDAPQGAYVPASVLFAALQHLEANPEFQVLNLSLAIPSTKFSAQLAGQCRAILRLLNNRGVVTIAAVGNKSSVTAPGAPSCWPEVVSVGATEEGGAPWKDSVTGNGLPELMAPGVDVYACRAGEADNTASGTSFACAIVSGIAALIQERRPHIPSADCRNDLRASCQNNRGVVMVPWSAGT